MPLHPVDQAPQAESPPLAAAETPLYELLQVAPTADSAVIRPPTTPSPRPIIPIGTGSVRRGDHAGAEPRPRDPERFPPPFHVRSQTPRGATAPPDRRGTWRSSANRLLALPRADRPAGSLLWSLPLVGLPEMPSLRVRAPGVAPPERGPPRPGLVLGWALATIFALFSSVLLVTRPLPATVEPWLGQAAPATPAPAQPERRLAAEPRRPRSPRPRAPNPLDSLASTLAVELTVTPLPVVQVATSSPSRAPTAQPTAALIAPTVCRPRSRAPRWYPPWARGARLRAESNLDAPILEVLTDGTA